MRTSQKFWSPSQNFRDEKIRRSAVDLAKIIQGIWDLSQQVFEKCVGTEFLNQCMRVHTYIAYKVCFALCKQIGDFHFPQNRHL